MKIGQADERALLEGMVDIQREQIGGILEDLDDEEARRKLVPSLTTPLGLVKHATFVEKVWFHARVAGVSRKEIGLPETVDESFVLEAEEHGRLDPGSLRRGLRALPRGRRRPRARRGVRLARQPGDAAVRLRAHDPGAGPSRRARRHHRRADPGRPERLADDPGVRQPKPLALRPADIGQW